MGFPAESEKKYTYQDYLKTPEGAKFQLIEGELIMVPSPSAYHQAVSRDLGFVLLEFVRKTNLGEVFFAPCDVYLDNHNVVQPDILFISKEKESLITKQKLNAVPDLVIEIVSDSSAYRDTVQKKQLYARFKIGEYWIVFPEEKVVEVYQSKDGVFKLYRAFKEKNSLTSPLLTNFKLDLSQVFG